MTCPGSIPASQYWMNGCAAAPFKMKQAGRRTYVVCAGKRVMGYDTLAVGAVAHAEAPGRVRRNMPNPLPVMVLGRLAVDKGCQRWGIGAGLLSDAVLRTLQAAEIAGIRAILVHAISEAAKRF
jgi:predicted N-acetyltransferase YhbS